MSGNAPATIDTRFPADDAAPAAALAAVRAFVALAGLSAGDEARLAIVVEELVCNAVEHGRPPPDSAITLGLTVGAGLVRLTLTDRGVPFDPGAAPPSDDVPERGGGAGLAVVLRWTRIERYERVLGVNWLTLAMPLAGG